MSSNDATWLLFLGPVLFLAAGAFVYWFTGRQDRALRPPRNASSTPRP